MSEGKEKSATEDEERHGGTLFMVLDYVPYDLAGLLADGVRFPMTTVRSYVYQLLAALQKLHQLNYIHRCV